MPAIPYPTENYPDDPLEIPIDTMDTIRMQIYHPGLITHQATSGAQFFLKTGLPRWRGNVTWAACYTNSRRAGAIEGYLASLTEGINISNLKHNRRIIDTDTIMKRGNGIGIGTVGMGVDVIEGQVFKLASGDLADRIFKVAAVNGRDIIFNPDIDIFGDDTSVTLDMTPANRFLRVRATPGATIDLPRGGTLSGPWNMSWIEGVG